MNEDLVTELIQLERRIAADEYKITLALAASGVGANKATLVEDLKRRISETTNRMHSLRVQLAETTGSPPDPSPVAGAARPKKPRGTRRSTPTETTD